MLLECDDGTYMRQSSAQDKAHTVEADRNILAMAPNQWSSATISQCVQIGMRLEFNNIDFV